LGDGNPGAFMPLLNDRRFVIHRADGTPLWSSMQEFDAGSIPPRTRASLRLASAGEERMRSTRRRARSKLPGRALSKHRVAQWQKQVAVCVCYWRPHPPRGFKGVENKETVPYRFLKFGCLEVARLAPCRFERQGAETPIVAPGFQGRRKSRPRELQAGTWLRAQVPSSQHAEVVTGWASGRSDRSALEIAPAAGTMHRRGSTPRSPR
jgi:hypothetical protein